MKAPRYQRAEMLTAAILAAAHELRDPVEGLEMTEHGVIAWTADRCIRLECRWDNDYAASGAPMLGGGAWSARYVSDCDASDLRAREDRAAKRKTPAST